MLEELFIQPLELYRDPAALATVVFHLMKEHVRRKKMLMAMEVVHTAVSTVSTYLPYLLR